MTSWTHVGTTTGVWDQRVGPAATIDVTSHASTQSGDLVIIHLGGHNSIGVPTVTGLGFNHAAGFGNVATFYRNDITGATTWNVFNATSRGAMWVCTTLRPTQVGATNARMSWVSVPSLNAAPEDFSGVDIMVARCGISGYAVESDAIADDINVTGNDPNYQELHSKVEDSVVHQIGPTRYCETYLQTFTNLDSANRNAAITWTRTDTGSPSSPSQSTPLSSGTYVLTYDAPAAPDLTFSASPHLGGIPLEVEFTVTATDGGVAVDTWELDYGDGSPTETGTGEIDTVFTHTYTSIDTFTASWTVAGVTGSPVTLEETITTGVPEPTENPVELVPRGRTVTIQELPFEVKSSMMRDPFSA